MSFVLESTNHVENITLENIKELYDFKLTVPERIEKKFPLLRFVSNGKFDIPDYFVYGILHLVSEEFLKVLNVFSISHQHFPVEWIHNNQIISMNVMHIIGETDFIDKEKSNAIIEDHGYIEEINKLVLIKEELNDKHLAIPKKYLDNLIVVSNEFKDEVESNNITGARFVSVGNYQP